MADEETTETPDGTTVSVTVPEHEEEAPAAAPVVVVADTGGDEGASSEDVDRWVALERWKAETEASIREAAEAAWDAKAEAWRAQDAVVEAEIEDVAQEEEIEELAEELEEVEETVEDEIAPASTKVHPMFRPFRDWFPKRES